MKLKSNLFNTKNAMNINAIHISDGEMTIHSTDSNDVGVIVKYIVESNGETCDFTISKKDFSTLAKLGEFDLTVENGNINVKNTSVKLTLANMVDTLRAPKIENLVPLTIVGKDILEAKDFIAEDFAKIECSGATVFDKGIIASDSRNLFVKYTQPTCTDGINIPKNVLKHIDEKSQVFTDGKTVVFVNGGTLVYSNLLAKTLTDFTNDSMKVASVVVKFDPNNLKYILNILNSYESEHIGLELVGSDLKITQHTTSGEFEYKLPVQVEKGEHLKIKTTQKSLNLIISKVDNRLGFCERVICIENKEDNSYTVATYYGKENEVR